MPKPRKAIRKNNYYNRSLPKRSIQQEVVQNFKRLKSKKQIINDSVSYMRLLDSRHSSYWIGKLLNAFIRQGKKSQAHNSLYKSFLLLKYNNKAVPVLLIFYILEKIKLIFKLKVWHFRKRKGKGKRVKPKEKFFPQIINESRQYALSLKWVLNELKGSKEETKSEKSQSLQFSLVKTPFVVSFYQKFSKLLVLSKLLSQRNQYYKRAVFFNHRLRFPWTRKVVNWNLLNSLKFFQYVRSNLWKKQKNKKSRAFLHVDKIFEKRWKARKRRYRKKSFLS